MNIIPAIDIRGGSVVRLSRGDFSAQTTYKGSPADVAKRWEIAGARSLHVVDLDGAREGRPVSLDHVRDICRAVKAEVELGGGIRDEEDIEKAIDAGVSKIVIGTRALDEKFLKGVVRRFGSAIVAGIDASSGVVFTKGWALKTKASAVDLAKMVESSGVKTINYTDISKDGMLTGPDVDSVSEVMGAVNIDVVLAGGISCIDDLIRLKDLPGRPLSGVIIGKALYEGKVDLAEAIRICGD